MNRRKFLVSAITATAAAAAGDDAIAQDPRSKDPRSKDPRSQDLGKDAEGRTIEPISPYRLGVIEVGPDDVVVLGCDHRLKPEAIQRMTEDCRAYFGFKIMILDGGLDLLAVLREKK